MKKAIIIPLSLLICTLSFGQKISIIKMKSYSKPIIKAEINGRKAFFLIDTGSSISLVNTSEMSRYQLTAAKSRERRMAIGFNGDSEYLHIITNANFILDSYFEYTRFYSMNLDKIVDSIFAETNIRIAGIVGADFLKKHHCVIDYGIRAMTITDEKINKRYLTSAR